jgi:hypothetical protein
MGLPDATTVNIICDIKLPSQRMYEIAWAIAKLQGYETLDDFITDEFLQVLEGHPEGNVGLDIDWGFKSR